jgi:hypothetical protein
MRRPPISTGAWIFSGLVCAAIIAPATVYAASITRVHIVGPVTASVDTQHQLLTTTVSPRQVIHASGVVHGPCVSIYQPPAHKAIVVTSLVYTYGSGTEGTENFGGVFTDTSCNDIADEIDGTHKFDTIEHTFPIGLPMPRVVGDSNGGDIEIFLTGYLIDSSSLPHTVISHTGRTKSMQP